jgi:cytochrome P450 family 110
VPTLPPGPADHAALQTFRYMSDPFTLLDSCAARYGDAFTLRFFRQPPVVSFNNPDVIKEIFAESPEVLRAGEANAQLEFAVGNGSVLLLDGKRHERERRLLMPPFHGERMATYLDQILAITDRVLGKIAIGETFSFHRAMQTLTLEVILECIFGITPGPRQDRLRELLQAFVDQALKPYVGVLGTIFPGTPLRQFLVHRIAPIADRLSSAPSLLQAVPAAALARCVRDLDIVLYEDIAERRAEGAEGKTDVMSMLIAARDEHGHGLSDAELRDEMITLLLAGHETTATTLAFTVGTLLTEPTILGRVQEELGRVVGSAPLSAERLRELKYLEATIKEVLRLYGPAGGFGRILSTPKRIGGHDLPAGVMVSAWTYLLHRDPRYWPDPERFDPERFLERRVRPTEFIPFGGGPRTCLGMAFALFEAKAVLARLFTRTTLRAVPGPKLKLGLRGLIYGPSHDVPVVLERRAPRLEVVPSATASA